MSETLTHPTNEIEVAKNTTHYNNTTPTQNKETLNTKRKTNARNPNPPIGEIEAAKNTKQQHNMGNKIKTKEAQKQAKVEEKPTSEPLTHPTGEIEATKNTTHKRNPKHQKKLLFQKQLPITCT